MMPASTCLRDLILDGWDCLDCAALLLVPTHALDIIGHELGMIYACVLFQD
jgi:hypothetical protein